MIDHSIGTAFALVGVNGTSGAYTERITITDCLLYNAHNGNNAGIATDPDGTAIPRGGAPDIGAFEFVDCGGTILMVTANGGRMEVEK
jgi:hypothetical protein